MLRLIFVLKIWILDFYSAVVCLGFGSSTPCVLHIIKHHFNSILLILHQNLKAEISSNIKIYIMTKVGWTHKICYNSFYLRLNSKNVFKIKIKFDILDFENKVNSLYRESDFTASISLYHKPLPYPLSLHPRIFSVLLRCLLPDSSIFSILCPVYPLSLLWDCVSKMLNLSCLMYSSWSLQVEAITS